NLSERIGHFMVRLKLVWKVASNAILTSMAQVLFKNVKPSRNARYKRQIQYLIGVITWRNPEVCFNKECRDMSEMEFNNKHFKAKGFLKIPKFVCRSTTKNFQCRQHANSNEFAT
ncbi:PIPO, partial [Potyvirus apii]|uniref:PIPO n=1 Tax=Potyvirus apii TaxID=168135 RepID=UPI00026C2435